MTSECKHEGYAFDFEVGSRDLPLRGHGQTLELIDHVRIHATSLALLMSVTMLGISAHTLSVYRDTYVSSDFLLPLWPDELNEQPTIGLIMGSAIVFLANAVSLVFSKVGPVRPDDMTLAQTYLGVAAPLIGLVAAGVAMSYFYVADASDMADTLLSWTCRWQSVPMSQPPDWGSLCCECRAAVYLSVLLVPVEVVVLAVVARQAMVERRSRADARAP